MSGRDGYGRLWAVALAAALVLALGSCLAGGGGGASDDSGPASLSQPQSQPPLPAASDGERGGGGVPDDVFPTVPAICREGGVLVGTAQSPLGVRATWRVGAGLPIVAASVVEGYEAAGDVQMRYGGYIDLLGNVWGCVVSSPGWVEVAVVREEGDRAEGGSDGQECLVAVMRLGEGEMG